MSILTPKLDILLFKFRIPSFHLFGIIGLIVGIICGLFVGKIIGLSAMIILLMSFVSICCFILLIILIKWATGKESLVYYHHEILILIMNSVTLMLLKQPILEFLDIALLGIAIFLAFGRIGCFSVGCCHGKPSNWGVKYGKPHVLKGFTSYYQDIKLFPIQLLESLFTFLICIVGVIIIVSDLDAGTFLIIYSLFYGIFRFLIEFYRGDPDRPYWHDYSEAQWTTVALLLVIAFFVKFNLFPYYYWHLSLVGILILIFSLSLVYKKRNTLSSSLIKNPVHIREMASCFEKLSTSNVITNNNNIKIYKTKLGVRLSGDMNNHKVKHLTISNSNNKLIDVSVAIHIANIFKMFLKNEYSYDIIDSGSKCYQIIYSKIS
ncbi:prolipoprotein diacylglyceryl transferase [Mariniflexile fucanivorans]|uniref:Prolipoprotein diacylglyceryl transferase n=1 Tax=Mariniflexile fucanivorans TaxID=264023 RepID=A0A4R1RAT3_9FLAO|nr:prolipoprotein diacylglyceryl transferase family protein [Mariniflexile fucanivorans]TCL62855.1 prolipoprotein diacylglyceryl transferase [Mariniflexile fucanivorans]